MAESLPGCERWERVFALFDEARSLARQERGAFLAGTCGADVELRAEVEALLEADGVEDGALEHMWTAPDPAAEEHWTDDLAGSEIGPYRLVEKLGEGGMGVVWAADQVEPLRRRVALKLIKPGLDTQELLGRFRAERDTLARMVHPNIAAVHDAGVTGGWRPYFVMERVEGLPLAEYCDAQRLTVAERVELFVPICQAVHHAHRRGILHRDLKPSNVLVAQVEGRPVPKVIDFGIAKTTGSGGAEATLFTQQGQALGTPEYMSPEQVERRLDIDTRTDVYSLGVMLYRLLSGTLPFEVERMRSGGLPELRRIVCEEQPARLAQRLDSHGDALEAVAAARRTDPRGLRRQLSGELAWIVGRAMARDREERYGGADELAADLERWRAGEPVQAGPPSVLYRARKLAARHRVAILATAAVLASLVTGLLATTVSLVEARRAQREAERQAAIAVAVNQFLNRDVLSQAGPARLGDKERTIGEAMEQAARSLDGRFQDQPLIEASIRQTVGSAFATLGRYDEAIAHLRRAHALRREHLGASDVGTLQAAADLVVTYSKAGRNEDFDALHGPTLEAAERSLGRGHEISLALLNSKGRVLYRRGDLEGALALERDLVARAREHLGDGDPKTAEAKNNLAITLSTLGRRDEAIPLLEEVLAFYRRTYGNDHKITAAVLANLGSILNGAGRLEEAEAILQEAVDLQTRIGGADHPDTLTNMMNLAAVQHRRGAYAEARRLGQTAWAGLAAARGADSVWALAAGTVVARAMDAEGRSREALPIFEKLVASARAKLPAGHMITGNILARYGHCLVRLGRYDQAKATLDEAYEILEGSLGADHHATQDTVASQIELYERLGSSESAALWRRRLAPAQ